MASSEALTSSTHSFAYSYRCFQKCFVKICKLQCHNFAFIDFRQVFTVLFEIFTLSSEIKLNLFQIPPLNALVLFYLGMRKVAGTTDPVTPSHNSTATKGDFREMVTDVAISWQLRCLHGNYGM